MIQTIVFATDLGVFTPYLVQHVVNLGQTLAARIVVVHAVEPLGSLGTAMVKTYLPEEKAREFQQKGMSLLLANIKDRLVDIMADEFIDDNLGLGQVSDVIVEAGRPADVILKYVKLTKADLIVMGSHGPNVEQGHSLGSVASKVLQLTKVPVYTVPMLAWTPAGKAKSNRQAR